MDLPAVVAYDASVPKKVIRPAKPTKADIRAVMKLVGAMGASKAGRARWEGVSKEERSRLAKKAVAAREAKRKLREQGRKP